jgi:hypothetical protein
VAHTGKLARAVVLDLALFDGTGDERHWQRAVGRAEWVAAKLGPDPEHGALIYHPGRLDPRNCSTSAIDSGECTDALGRLLLHPNARQLAAPVAERLRETVIQNADTYLRSAVIEKGITNQRLWAAMGLATAWSLDPRDAWLTALRASVDRALEEQHSDGSWAYQPDAVREGAHVGAADLTVYYHSRCLAFLLHIAERVPTLDTAPVRDAMARGLAFLALVITPDGLKPLALEGKRWFWDGSYEAGSAAYDVFALARGAELFGRPGLSQLAALAWRQLQRHQLADGSIKACLEPDAHDFVCPDFHTADLAWTAQVIERLAAPPSDGGLERQASVRRAADAGVWRLENTARVALLRTDKLPANTQFGGAVGGGLAAVVDSSGTRHLEIGEGQWTATRRASVGSALESLHTFLRDNPPRREAGQWLFVFRLLLSAGQPSAAWRRLWRGYLGPLLGAWRERAGSAWQRTAETHDTGSVLECVGQLARANGTVPEWASGLVLRRRYALESTALRVTEQLTGTAPKLSALRFSVPAKASDVEVSAEHVAVRRSGGAIHATPQRPSFCVDVTYAL